MTLTSDPNWDFKDNFITVIDNALDSEFCDYVIEYFEKVNASGLCKTRKDSHLGSSPEFQSDLSHSIDIAFSPEWEIHKKISDEIKKHFDVYFNKYIDSGSFIISGIKIQKTEKSEGYHIWHHDGGGPPLLHKRVVTFIYYLNDVESGGETEFLYQSERVQPVKGRGVWFPSCYTHIHRGNPPLSGTKYILTGWLEYNEQ